MCNHSAKSRFFRVIFVVFVFCVLIVSGGCDGDGSSSDVSRDIPNELIAEAGYFGKYQPDSNEICFKLAEDTQLDWEEHENQLEELFGMELLEIAQLAKSEGENKDNASLLQGQNTANGWQTAALRDGESLLVQQDSTNNTAEQDDLADSSKLQVLNFGLNGSQEISILSVPANFMGNIPELKESVEKLIIPEDVKEIGANAFADMPKLSRVVIFGTPNIGENAFANCPNLEFVSIGSGNYRDIYREITDERGKRYPSMHEYMRSHKDVNYAIGERAFANCPKLRVMDFGFVAQPKFADNVFEAAGAERLNRFIIYVPYPSWYRKIFEEAVKDAKISQYRPDTRVFSKTWMADLPDDQLISQLSIPATHDSATFGLDNIVEIYGRTQGLNFEDQFNKGVRCFDLRLGHYTHSDLYLGHAFCSGVTFSAAMDTIKGRLTNNPKDFAIIEFAWDGSADTEKYKEMQDAVVKQNNDAKAVLFKPDLRLKDVRGKFLFMNCDVNDTKGVALNSSICCRWGSGVFGLKYNGSIGLPNTPMVQRNVSWTQNKWSMEKTGADIQDKTDQMFEMFDAFAAHVMQKPEENVWCFNFASAYMKDEFGSATNYPLSAEYQNKRAADHIANLNGPTGVVYMDFAGIPNGDSRTKRAPAGKKYNVNGDLLLNAVIDHNFIKF